MKISHRNVPYSDIPRLVKEGVIKVGTRVRACEDQEKYPNVCFDLFDNKIEKIKAIDGSFIMIGNTTYDLTFHSNNRFLDILEDEEEEGVQTHSKIGNGADPNPLSFSEPLTKEAVGKIIYHPHSTAKKIENVSIDGEWAYVVELEFISESDRWRLRKQLSIDGWSFSNPETISIEEAEKLTGKKIKR